MNLSVHSIMHLRAHLTFHFREHLEIHTHLKKKMHFTWHLRIHLTVQSRGAPDCIFVDDAPKDALMDLHKNAQKAVCEVALKGCT